MVYDYDDIFGRKKETTDIDKAINGALRNKTSVLNLGKGPLSANGAWKATGSGKDAVKNYAPPKGISSGGATVVGSANVPTGTASQVQNLPVTNMQGFKSGAVPIRQAMNQLGYEDDRIGYDNGYITLDGNRYIQEDSNINGTTYTTGHGIIAADNAKRRTDGREELVGMSEYLYPKGGGISITYADNNMPMVNGHVVEGAVVIDDVAFAPKSAIEAAYKKAKESNGYMTNRELMEQALSPTSERAKQYEAALNDFADKPFEWNPEEDKTYQSVKAEYERMAKNAAMDTNAVLSAATGGYGNSYAATAAAVANANIMNDFARMTPEYEEAARSRYEDWYNKNVEAVDRYGSDIERAMLLNDASVKDMEKIDEGVEKDYQRDVDNRSFNENVRQFNAEYGLAVDETEFNQWLNKFSAYANTLANSENFGVASYLSLDGTIDDMLNFYNSSMTAEERDAYKQGLINIVLARTSSYGAATSRTGSGGGGGKGDSNGYNDSAYKVIVYDENGQPVRDENGDIVMETKYDPSDQAWLDWLNGDGEYPGGAQGAAYAPWKPEYKSSGSSGGSSKSSSGGGSTSGSGSVSNKSTAQNNNQKAPVQNSNQNALTKGNLLPVAGNGGNYLQNPHSGVMNDLKAYAASNANSGSNKTTSSKTDKSTKANAEKIFNHGE